MISENCLIPELTACNSGEQPGFSNINSGFWIGDFGLLVPGFARLPAIEFVALFPRIDISNVLKDKRYDRSGESGVPVLGANSWTNIDSLKWRYEWNC